MRETSVYDYYSFGYNYNLLKGGCKDYLESDAVDAINAYLSRLSELDLRVTLNAAHVVRDVLDTLDKDSKKILDSAVSLKLSRAVSSLDVTLDSELQLRAIYTLTPKRFDLHVLTKNPASLLAAGVYEKLSTVAEKDFRSACKLIAFNAPTASAFHLMRCVEECLKQLYFTFKKTKRLEKPMWGPMIDELKKKKGVRPDQILLENLDHIRKNYRNPTQHPEKFYSIDEAQDLLSNTVASLNMIIKSIESQKV